VAAVVLRLPDPTRVLPQNRLLAELREIGVGFTSLVATCAPILVGLALGGLAAYLLDRHYGADSRADVAAFSACAVLGIAWNIRLWVNRARHHGAGDPADAVIDAALADLRRALRIVLGTPTLVYVFAGGALISFGMNGIVAWAPAFITRTLGLNTQEATRLLGVAGLVAGTAGTLAGGWIADTLRKRYPNARVLVCGAGFIVGVPLAIWLLSVRRPEFFVPIFYAAFFFLTWYNGPLTATIFDVVPARIGTTVVGAYLLFIHVAGDSIAFPLIGALSDHFGLDRAIYVLPIAALAGGLTVLGAARFLDRDHRRALDAATGSWPAVRRGSASPDSRRP
jgi:sugar phosphate permease